MTTMPEDKMEAEYKVMDELADQYVELARAIGMMGHEDHDEIMVQARMLYDFFVNPRDA
jgi:hypothetical protein